MKAHFHMKSGATITFDHITTIEATDDGDGNISGYTIKWQKGLTGKERKLLKVAVNQIEAITTTERET